VTGTSAEEEHGDKEAEPSFWDSFTRADARLFLMTFAGTVAANVVTVMVVAVALIASRPPSSGRPTAGSVPIDLACSAAGVMAVGIGITALRRTRMNDRGSRTIALMIGAVTVFMGLISSVYLLVLLGYAVGVK